MKCLCYRKYGHTISGDKTAASGASRKRTGEGGFLMVGFGAMAPSFLCCLLCCCFGFARQDLVEGGWFSWGGAV